MSADALNLTGAPLVEGKYLMYKDRPLVREGDTICYGDMNEKCILILEIISYKEVDGKKLPDKIMIQVIDSKDPNKIIRQGSYSGLHDAFNDLHDYPERTPLMGYYDEENPEVCDWEIKWALEHGINCFIYCWYRKLENEAWQGAFACCK